MSAMARVVFSMIACSVSAFTVACAVIIGVSLVNDAAGARASSAAVAAFAATPFSSDVVRRLDALIAAFPGGAGVWIGDPVTSAPLYSRNADRPVITASLYKLGVLLEAETRVDRGTLRYSSTVTIQDDDVSDQGSVYDVGTTVSVDQALEAAITLSDNGTALALWRMLGGNVIDASLAREGISDFHVTLDRSGNTLVTPRALGTFFRLLTRRELASPAASDRMIARLKRQRINDRLPAALPAGVLVAHKTGNLDGLIHDAGIIFTPAGPRIVVVMTWDASGGANAFIATVGAVVYGASLAPASPRLP